jgi:hypothetical protein
MFANPSTTKFKYNINIESNKEKHVTQGENLPICRELNYCCDLMETERTRRTEYVSRTTKERNS